MGNLRILFTLYKTYLNNGCLQVMRREKYNHFPFVHFPFILVTFPNWAIYACIMCAYIEQHLKPDAIEMNEHVITILFKTGNNLTYMYLNHGICV